MVFYDSGKQQSARGSELHLGDVLLNIQGWMTALSDEELVSDQAIIDLMFLRVNERSGKSVCGFSKQQRGLFQVRVACVRCICGPGDVGDECPDGGEECRHFSPPAFV